jgi:adenosine deaminase
MATDLMSTVDAAKLARVTRQAMQLAFHEGRIKGEWIGKSITFRRRDVLKFKQSRKRKPKK